MSTNNLLTPEIIKHLRTHNGGTFAVTTNTNVWLPYQSLTDVSPFVTEGYWVAVESFTIVSDRYLDDSSTQHTVQRASDQLDTYYEFIGFWIDKGVWYVDRVKHFLTLTEATEHAKFYNQQAIWDIANNKEITI